MNKPSQHHLIEQCRRNNREAQLALYKQYCEAMYCVAHRLMGNEQDAEDAMQEAFVKAFQKLGQFSGEVTFGAWLKKIVINKCLDALKTKKKRVQFENDLAIDATVEEEDWEVAEQISVEDVKSAIYTLPDKYTEVIMLYLIEGYNHEEIAQILDITIIASRTRLMRGKQKLKALLKQQYYGSRS